ncbi:unnamed protein product [Paramecium sonneborni]|uniref:Uncharacterized protein n=1 Tax=Paramecium sonneborni TaxID=65129 RepID=A0A8S1M4F7_9CILI|nr:unnamed protein product [Paramecium sonneborni]
MQISLFLTLQQTQISQLKKDELDYAKLNDFLGTNYYDKYFSYSGNISLRDDGQLKFHYLFQPAIDSAIKKPLILQLLKRSECSLIIFIAESIEFEENLHTLITFLNLQNNNVDQYAQNRIFNICWILKTQSDESNAVDNVNALIEYLLDFQISKIKIYFESESYAGICVSTLVQEIINNLNNQLIVEFLTIYSLNFKLLNKYKWILIGLINFNSNHIYLLIELNKIKSFEDLGVFLGCFKKN